jgi:PAS domain S-box-containing protein
MPIPVTDSWMRQLTHLHERAVKAGSRSPADPLSRIATETLAACADLLDRLGRVEIECERLRDDKSSATAAYTRLFEFSPAPALITDRDGIILRANRAASQWLNLAARRLEGRQLLLYAEDRQAFRRLLERLPRGDACERVIVNLRPRERRAVETSLTVSALSEVDGDRWLWLFAPRDAASQEVVVDDRDVAQAATPEA